MCVFIPTSPQHLLSILSRQTRKKGLTNFTIQFIAMVLWRKESCKAGCRHFISNISVSFPGSINRAAVTIMQGSHKPHMHHGGIRRGHTTVGLMDSSGFKNVCMIGQGLRLMPIVCRRKPVQASWPSTLHHLKWEAYEKADGTEYKKNTQTTLICTDSHSHTHRSVRVISSQGFIALR